MSTWRAMLETIFVVEAETEEQAQEIARQVLKQRLDQEPEPFIVWEDS